MNGTLAVTGDDDADHLVNTDPFAGLLAMMLDQQVPMEWAFMAPYRLRERLGGRLDAATVASTDPDELLAAFKGPPALHRFPGSMAKRAQEMSAHIVEHYGGDTAAIWDGVTSGDEVLARLRALPGFGEDKSRIFLAVLAKRMGVQPKGWEEAAGPFGDATPRSVADIDSPTHSPRSARGRSSRRRRASRSRCRQWRTVRPYSGRGATSDSSSTSPSTPSTRRTMAWGLGGRCRWPSSVPASLRKPRSAT